MSLQQDFRAMPSWCSDLAEKSIVWFQILTALGRNFKQSAKVVFKITLAHMFGRRQALWKNRHRQVKVWKCFHFFLKIAG